MAESLRAIFNTTTLPRQLNKIFNQRFRAESRIMSSSASSIASSMYPVLHSLLQNALPLHTHKSTTSSVKTQGLNACKHRHTNARKLETEKGDENSQVHEDVRVLRQPLHAAAAAAGRGTSQRRRRR